MSQPTDDKLPPSIDDALIRELKSDNLKEIAAEGAEVTLDHFLDTELIKDIPFFGILYKGYKSAVGIREAIFAKKVYKFLTQLKDIPKEKREAFLKRLEEDKTYRHKVGEKLLIIIDQLDDLEKPEIIGRLLKSTINGKIRYEDFLRYSSIVQRLIMPDLMVLKEMYPRGSGWSNNILEYFASLGIVSIKIGDRPSSIAATVVKSNDPRYVIKYEMNQRGRDLVKYGLYDDQEEE